MGEDDTPLASLSLTHVHYVRGDPVSYVAAWLSLIPQALCVSYVTLLWATREIEVALMFAGQLACEAVNFALKRLIKEERPKQMLGKGYGMPSSHAQFLSFFAAYLALFLLLRHQPTSTQKPRQQQQQQQHGPIPLPSPRNQLRAMAAATVLLAAGVAAARIYLQYHTPAQVAAGVVAGTTFGVVWFVATGLARSRGFVAYGVNTQLARQFRVRDLVCEEDLAQPGWTAWEARGEKDTKRTEEKRTRKKER